MRPGHFGENTARLLESLGHHVEPAAATALDAPGLSDSMPALLTAAVTWELDTWSQRRGEELPYSALEPMNAMLAEVGRSVTAVQWSTGSTPHSGGLVALPRWGRTSWTSC
ncbi:hypothetical protein [Amycolatopsis sp. H20-H5]|uniref:hypothetical protein n=1 Tax=Amycolatopsis sp. H20-H5 TaxID=3046309 RepID=UPI002DBEFD37|nr:hypothetical protein [Amycolatopsis sp. H20-H5]MEC3974180.1 hypothetical protein [Amycolatopsis sp. H20-H5]